MSVLAEPTTEMMNIMADYLDANQGLDDAHGKSAAMLRQKAAERDADSHAGWVGRELRAYWKRNGGGVNVDDVSVGRFVLSMVEGWGVLKVRV